MSERPHPHLRERVKPNTKVCFLGINGASRSELDRAQRRWPIGDTVAVNSCRGGLGMQRLEVMIGGNWWDATMFCRPDEFNREHPQIVTATSVPMMPPGAAVPGAVVTFTGENGTKPDQNWCRDKHLQKGMLYTIHQAALQQDGKVRIALKGMEGYFPTEMFCLPDDYPLPHTHMQSDKMGAAIKDIENIFRDEEEPEPTVELSFPHLRQRGMEKRTGFASMMADINSRAMQAVYAAFRLGWMTNAAHGEHDPKYLEECCMADFVTAQKDPEGYLDDYVIGQDTPV